MARAITRHQHLDPFRKYLLRKHLLKHAIRGPVFMPFCGDGDLAVGGSKDGALAHEVYGCPGVYLDRFVYAADLDPDRVQVAKQRIANGQVRVADCDVYPFLDVDTGPIAVADFDAWSEPYPAFRSFWQNAEKADRLVLFFTDAHRLGIMADGTHIQPDGTKVQIDSLTERRARYHFYLSKHIMPWMGEYVRPYGIKHYMRYTRGMLTYFGVVLQR